MPIYEWECLACEITFEDLAPLSAGRLERACPSCGRMSPRVVSAFAIASGAIAQPQPAAAAAARRARRPSVCVIRISRCCAIWISRPRSGRSPTLMVAERSTTTRKVRARRCARSAACRHLLRPRLRPTPICTTRAAIKTPAPPNRIILPPDTRTATAPRTRPPRVARPDTLPAQPRTAIEAALNPLISRLPAISN